jgi:TPR repeat protein
MATQTARAAASRGRSEAQFILGCWYDEGTGVVRDPFLAARWYRAAARQGHRRAQENLGLLLWTGRGVRRDRAEALRWFDRAGGNQDGRWVVRLGVRLAVLSALALAALVQRL